MLEEGRYDDLLKSLGAKKNIPAVGAAINLKKYMKDLITIGLPSKGRLKDKAISFFNDRGHKFYKVKKKEIILELLKIKLTLKSFFFMLKKSFKD